MVEPNFTYIWDIVVGIFITVFGALFKGTSDRLTSLEGRLQATRENLAQNHIPRAEHTAELDKIVLRVDAGFTRLENKLDELRKQPRS